MINYPKISVIVPMYNSENYIDTCLESILNQTFTDFEIVVIDDCSTDRSFEIVSQYTDPRIKIYRQIKNSGESESRNLGLKIARGKYIYFMDHDDLILEKHLETFFNAAEESQADVVFKNSFFETRDVNISMSTNVRVDQKYFLNSMPRFLSQNLEDRLKCELMEEGMFVAPWCKIQRRDFLLEHKIQFPLTTLNGDVLFQIAEFCMSKKIQVIDACGYVWRIHSNQTIRSAFDKLFRKAIHSMPIALEYLHEIFASQDLIEPMSQQFKFDFEIHIIRQFFRFYICRLYEGGMQLEDINSILNEELPHVCDSELLKIIFNAFAIEMLNNEKLKRERRDQN